MKIAGLAVLLISALLIAYLTVQSHQASTAALPNLVPNPAGGNDAAPAVRATPQTQMRALREQLERDQQRAADQHGQIDPNTERELGWQNE